MDEQARTIRALFARCPVLPVLMIEEVRTAVPLAQALLAGGISMLEVTLRTEAAREAARAIMREVEGAVVGIGTLTRPDEFREVRSLGAAFAVSPGFTPPLGEAAHAAGLPFVPGVATASEVIAARAAGFSVLKFFPAEIAGGVPALKSFRPLFPEVAFCPTGGVGPQNLRTYLDLANVIGVGGSWLAPAEHIAAGDWDAITALARAAVDTARRSA